MPKPIETAKDLLKSVAAALQKHNIQYFVTGGFAVSIWGRPRFTADIDLVVALSAKAIPVLAAELSKLSSAAYLDQDQMVAALRRHGEFNFIEPNAGVKVDFWVIGDSQYDRQRLKRRKIIRVDHQPIAFSSPEDLILSKLLWWKESKSERHLEDVKSVLAIQKKLDWQYLTQWAKRLKVFSKLTELKNGG